MQVTDVRAVIAIGLRGQFGLRGHLPWEGNRGREYVADVERFFELTRGHVLIMGHRTFTSVPDFAFQNRDIVEIHASDKPEEVLARFPTRVVFIGGGPPVYAAYAPFIRHWDISRCPMTVRPTAGSIQSGWSRTAGPEPSLEAPSSALPPNLHSVSPA